MFSSPSFARRKNGKSRLGAMAPGLFLALSISLMMAPTWSTAQTADRSAGKLEPQFAGIGRAATPKEVAAWDIDVRPDFKGLPTGSGSVAKGQDIWEAKCASCHGVFGESNQVFTPLIGGTTAKDVSSGNVASLKDNSYPGRTTLMKLSTVSTLWDYINRAMPWNAPKSLTTEEVYAVTAFMLNLGGVVPDDFTLSDKNMREVQARLPNRNGLTTQHSLWPGKEFGGVTRPDVKAVPCMKNCDVGKNGDAKVASFVPDYAMNAHGNLALQNRLVGAQRGVDTANATTATAATAVGAVAAAPAAPDNRAALALAAKYSCTACHGMAQKIVGPSFADLAKKYPNGDAYLAEKIIKGGSGVWGAIPMPPQSMAPADVKVLAAWIATGAAR